MYRSLWCKLGVNLKSTASIINVESSSALLAPTAKYFLYAAQNQNVVISNPRVTSIFFCSFSTTSNPTSSYSSSDSSFVVSYLINSCGLSENEAITASKKLNFKTASNLDSVLTFLKAYGFTEPHISKLINNYPSILSSNPHETLKPKLDFFKSKGLDGLDLANFISNDPSLHILRQNFYKGIVPSFDILKSIVQSDQNVIKMIGRDSWILLPNKVKNVMVNIELLRNEGVPQTNISKCLIQQPRAYTQNANRFKEIVEKVKDMGFNHLQTTFLNAIRILRSMTEANWRKKMDVYKRWGWPEDKIQSAFRKNPICMTISEKKIMAVMNFLVNDMGYDSSSIAECSIVLNYSLKGRIIPRCSVIRILISRVLIREKVAISTLSTMVDKSFLEKFVIKYEQEVPELMKVFKGQLSYQDLLQS